MSAENFKGLSDAVAAAIGKEIRELRQERELNSAKIEAALAKVDAVLARAEAMLAKLEA